MYSDQLAMLSYHDSLRDEVSELVLPGYLPGRIDQ